MNNKTVMHKPLIGTLITLGLVCFTQSARADDFDCFPLCEQQATPSASVKCDGSAHGQTRLQSTVAQAEALNDRVKPIKEVVGYVRSPQGLAIKLVNDHVVKIPKWVGYAIDPVGSVKNRAIDEARGRAKTALRDMSSSDGTCAAVSVETPAEESAPIVLGTFSMASASTL